MSFDIFLVASSATPGSDSFGPLVREVLDREGASQIGVAAHRLRDGGEVDIYYAGGEPSVMFAVYGGIPAALPALLLNMAQALGMFIVPATDSGEAYRPLGTPGDPPEDFLPVKDVATPEELEALLLA
jgi:hypothetical protein